MPDYKIITDSACDLPDSMLSQLGLSRVPMSVIFRGESRGDTVEGEAITEIYSALRAGEPATTAAVNPESWAQVIEPALADGFDALVIAFSSGLSTTYQSAVIAADDLAEKYPGRKVYVIDSRCASLGQGLLMWYTCRKRDEGATLEELRDYVEEIKPHLCHWFTVDDLMYLKRGGRIGAATAIVGTMLNIKPVLHVDDEGHLVSAGKARGRKASIEALAAKMGQLGAGYDNSAVYICHGDCIGDAKYLEQLVREKYGVKDVFIGYTGVVIGSHSGPGTLALFFLGEHR